MCFESGLRRTGGVDEVQASDIETCDVFVPSTSEDETGDRVVVNASPSGIALDTGYWSRCILAYSDKFVYGQVENRYIAVCFGDECAVT